MNFYPQPDLPEKLFAGSRGEFPHLGRNVVTAPQPEPFRNPGLPQRGAAAKGPCHRDTARVSARQRQESRGAAAFQAETFHRFGNDRFTVPPGMVPRLRGGRFLPLGRSSTGDAGDERTVIGLDATGAAKFYHAEISKPQGGREIFALS